MFYKRTGLPEEDEIVLCKVTKIFPNSVFVDLLEFNDSGMVHISEVAPGRIRNLRDYVSIGRQIVCKVLRIDREKGHIDLSLRRVNSNQRQAKLDEIKQELKAESVVKNLSKKLTLPVEELYKKIVNSVFKEYSHLWLCFQDVVADKVRLEELGLDQKIAAELTEMIKEKFKPPKIIIQGEIKLQTYDSHGVNNIKYLLEKIKTVSENIELFYLGGGRYRLVLVDAEYKPAEKKLEQIKHILEKFNDDLSTATFEREEK